MPIDVCPILAGDHTAWPRPDALTLQERTIEHQATGIYGNRPITVGQGYSTIAWIPGLFRTYYAKILVNSRLKVNYEKGND